MSGTMGTRVGQVMGESQKRVDALATVEAAIDQMRGEGVGSLVIDHRHDGDEYGIIVIADIAAKVIAENRSPARTNVYEVMSKPVLTVAGGMDIKYAIKLLSRFGLARALVTESGQLVGLVTLREMVFRYLPEDGAGS